MNIEEILDMLDELIDSSWTLPLSGGRSVVDVEKVRDLIDDIRLNLPSEIKQAKAIVADRNEILSNAKREADSILLKAEERAKALCSNEEVVKQANQKANEILSQASMKTKEMKKATSEFADNLLRTTEETLLNALNGVKTTRQTIRTQK